MAIAGTTSPLVLLRRGRRLGLTKRKEIQMPCVLAVILAACIAVLSIAMPRYRRDIRTARSRLDSVDSLSVRSKAGSVEYTDVGNGPCLLVSHGIFHGCDGGQRSARDVVSGRRIV